MEGLKPKKILLVWIGRLGDLAVSTPFINSIRNKYPKAQITLLVRSYVKPLAKTVRGIDKVTALPALKCPASLLSFIKNLVLTRYDLCVDLNSSYSRTSGSLVLLSKASVRVSFKKYRSNWFYTHTIAKPKENEHMLSRYKRMSDFFKADYKPVMTLDIPDAEAGKAKKLLADIKITQKDFKVAIHPGNFKKHGLRWPRENFIALSDRIAQLPDAKQIYITGPGEEKIISQMVEQIPQNAKQLPPMPITLTCALLKQVDLLIVCGTGTMHLGTAMQTPMITILNQYAYQCWRPLNENAVNITSGVWDNCRTVEVEEVWNAFLEIYRKKTRQKSNHETPHPYRQGIL
jgi:ADP-heptose:LPS heptosyltransferase